MGEATVGCGWSPTTTRLCVRSRLIIANVPPPNDPRPGADAHTLRAPGRSRVFGYRRFRFQVTRGPDRRRECASSDDEPELSVGTAPGNHLVLTDPLISRHHLVVTSTPRGFHLRDLGSTNGTLIAGCRIESAYLEPGTQIRIGETSLSFSVLDEKAYVPLSQEGSFGALLGESPAMRRIFEMLPRISGSDTTVLIEGETGTGKGVLAEAIHEASPRARGPFAVVDCGSIPHSLIESELFGHERGAFTGADERRIGALESASGGTLFLDEIGELPRELQPKLLRALEERAIRRVGSTAPVKLDVRIVAATNRDLRLAVNQGEFRSDLYYRLNVVRLWIPPLRERREDIAPLVARFAEEMNSEPAEMPGQLMARWQARDWPGNVRELRNAVERAILLGDQSLLDEAAGRGGGTSAAADMEADVPFRVAKERTIARWERDYLARLLQGAGGNVSAAARTARMDRKYLIGLIRRYKLAAREE
jgi:DNA-binding NtrC family response regulator